MQWYQVSKVFFLKELHYVYCSVLINGCVILTNDVISLQEPLLARFQEYQREMESRMFFRLHCRFV